MTWLGKILTFVVMIGTVVWAYFTVETYVTRVNWKAELERERAGRKAAETAHRDEQKLFLAKYAALEKSLAAEQARNKAYQEQVSQYEKDAAVLAKVRTDLQEKQAAYDATQKIRQGTIDRTLAELKLVRERNDVLENQVVALILQTEEARRQETKAKNEAKLALQIADDNAKKVEELIQRVADLRASGGRDAVTRSLTKPPPPVLSNLRGEVTDVSGDLVTLSIGIDAGLAVGTTLDIYRLNGEARYLGTVKITSPLNLFPKSAIATFIPADGTPVKNLRPEQLPKKGDEVRPLSAINGGQ